MVTIAHLVEKIIEQKPFLQEGLSRGIINNAALAEELRPELERELKKKVKFSAVNMALRRLSEKLEHHCFPTVRFAPDTDIAIKSNLVEIILHKNKESQAFISKLSRLVGVDGGSFLTITQGLYEIMILTNQANERKIVAALPKRLIKMIIHDLSSLTLKIPPKSIETAGLFYLVTKTLNWENITIIDLVSTLTELTLIIHEEDAAKSFNLLRALVKGPK